VPFGEFVAPGSIELRTAELLGVFRRECKCDRAIRPLEPSSCCGPLRALAARRNLQKPGRAFDHDLAHVMLGFANQCDLQRPFAGIRARTMGDPRTHSAPSLVLPAPRPPSMSQVVHGSPLFACGGSS
jgi:hypothetical protein